MWFERDTYRPLTNHSTYADSETDDDKSPSSLDESHHHVRETFRRRWPLLLSIFLNVILAAAMMLRHVRLPLFDNIPKLTRPWAGSATEELLEPYIHPLREAPEFGSLKQVVFEENARFVGDSPEVDAEWAGLWPLGKGFVKAHGRNDEVEDYYVVSAFHQFHCLDVIRVFYNLVAAGKKITDFKHIHVPHCLEYLRQTVVCHADPTLEFTMEVSKEEDPRPGVHRFVDGQYVTHQCRDYQALVMWAGKHSYKNSSRILHDVDIE